jgi:hypothetical protein
MPNFFMREISVVREIGQSLGLLADHFPAHRRYTW